MQNSKTSDIINHHLTAFGNNDLEEIMKDYTEDSELLTPERLLKGVIAIREFFTDYFVTVPTGSIFEMKKLIITGNTAYIVWSSDSKAAAIPMGTDTFFINGGKITLHTVAAHILNK